MKIEFQYFEGCPNSKKTLSNLKDAIKDLGVEDNSLEIVEVPDLDKAQEVNFQGSPTILINGKDIYTDKEPESFNYTCRVYTFGNETTGVLPIEFLRRRILTKYNNKQNRRKMKRMIILTLLTLGWFGVQAQGKFVTREGHAHIYSSTPVEDIRAENHQVTSTIDTETGDMVFSIPVQSFEFEKSLMQKHFNNSNFMDSKTYPRIRFVGKIQNLADVNFSTDGSYTVSVKGDLTIRDVTKPINEQGTIEVKNGKIIAKSVFVVKGISEYNVGKPKGSKKNNVAEDIEVTFKGEYVKE